MIKQTLLFITLSLPLLVRAQDCNCSDAFQWLKKTFEENDAGFSYVMDTKGKQAYEKHNEVFSQKVEEIEDPQVCRQTFQDWLAFFRSGHIGISYLGGNSSNQNVKKESPEEVINKFKDWETVDVDLIGFKNHLKSKQKPDYEGIWKNGIYKIGIKKQGKDYIGFIISADSIYWRKGQVKLRIENKDGQLSSTYYMKDHSPRNFDQAELIGKNLLSMGFIALERMLPEFEEDPEVSRYIKAMSAEKPYFEQLSDKANLLRIPSFEMSNKPIIDEVISNNREQILKTENLIIDLRGNGGGSDGSYSELIPLLYTNPIRTVGVEFWSTPLNNQRMLDFINNPEYGIDEETKKWAQAAYDSLSTQLGKFVNLNEEILSETTLDTIFPYPKQVAILIDGDNGSTTEQFLLAAKQSKKVKLFGATTFGVLDISNMYFVDSPCKDFRLNYCLTRSMRIPEMAIDDKGIQPDYFIHKSIPKFKWIDFAEQILLE